MSLRDLMHGNPKQAESYLALALALAAERETWVLGTGSLYLVGDLRRRWFSDRLIVEARSPWPVPPEVGHGSGSAVDPV